MVNSAARISPPVGEPFDDGEIDLGPYVRLLWRSRFLLLAAALLVAALFAGWALTTPRSYEARAILSLLPGRLPSVEGGLSNTTTTADYRPILESPNLAALVITALGLDGNGLLASRFFGSVVTVEEIRNTRLFILRGRSDDPGLITRIVNRTAELAVQESRRLINAEGIRVHSALEGAFNGALAHLQQAESKLLTFKTTSQIELLRKDTGAMLEQRGGLPSLLIQVEVAKAKLATAESELSARQRIDTVVRTIDSDPALLESARSSSSRPSDLLGIQLRDESISPVYRQLDADVAESRILLAALERQKEQLTNVQRLDAPQQAQLSRLYAEESELMALQAEADLARRSYQDVALAYQSITMQTVGLSSSLQILEVAGLPDAPLPRHVLTRTLLAFGVGLFLTAVLVLAYHGLRS